MTPPRGCLDHLPGDPPAPGNDNFANATVITGDDVTVTGTNVNATKQSGEPTLCGNPGGKSVWWSWTADAGGQVTINTEGSNFDTMLGVFTGASVSNLKLVAQNDDVSFRDLTSSVTFTVTSGTTYYIDVDGYASRSGAPPAATSR